MLPPRLADHGVPTDADPFFGRPDPPDFDVRPTDRSGFQPGRGALPSYLSTGSRDKSTLRAEQGRCISPAKGIRWRMHDGSLEPVRCGASNRCDYCAMFAAFEAALMLKLDAQRRCPTVGLTTTTRDPDFGYDALRKAEQALWRQLRLEAEKRGDEKPEYVGFLEWTTGEGTHAAGVRRPHLHHLVKGVPADDARLVPITLGDGTITNELEQHVSELWQRYTGDAWIVDCRPLRTPAGAIAYLALHHHKRPQAPPPGFRGRRLRPSKHYYERVDDDPKISPVEGLRRLARKLAQDQRVVIAAKRVIARELFREDPEVEVEADASLTEALVGGLRDLAEHPLEQQYDLFTGEIDHERERKELVERTAEALRRIRKESPPELVRVREKPELDKESGVVHYVATAILGPIEAKVSKRMRETA